MAQIGVTTPDVMRDVIRATGIVLSETDVRVDSSRGPAQYAPVYRVKITGAADADGVYPGVLMQLNPTTLAWTELGECYAYKVDTL